MFLVVISVQFHCTKERETSRIKANQKSELIDKNTSCWEQILGAIWHSINKIPRPLKKAKQTKSKQVTSLQIFCCCCFDRLANTNCFIMLFKARGGLNAIIKSSICQNLIFSAILLNTFSMAIEHHGQVSPKLIFYSSSGNQI